MKNKKQDKKNNELKEAVLKSAPSKDAKDALESLIKDDKIEFINLC